MASRIPVSVRSRKTDPLIKCIIHNNSEILRKLIRGRDINGLYSSEVWEDDVTPLTAAVLYRNKEICSYLLKKSADPNKSSTNGWTPLHYAALNGVPLSFVKRLLAAKAKPGGNEPQILTPLQCAVDRDREDIVKALIEAGALPENNYGRHPELDKKVERMIHQISPQGDVFEKVHLFFSLFCALRTKNLTEVHSLYKEHLFQEHPFLHTILFEHYCVFSGQGVDQYRQIAIKWLKDTKSADRYIEGFIKHFPKLPRQYWRVALTCMYAALCVSESITTEVFCDLESILTNKLQKFENAQRESINDLILKILYVITKKTDMNSERASSYMFLNCLLYFIFDYTPECT